MKLNGVHQSEMPCAPMTAKELGLPLVCKSERHKKYTDALKYAAFEFFVACEKHVLVAQQSAKSETIDITLNKASINLTGKEFSDISDYPITLNDDVSGVKACVDVDEENGEFLFDING